MENPGDHKIYKKLMGDLYRETRGLWQSFLKVLVAFLSCRYSAFNPLSYRPAINMHIRHSVFTLPFLMCMLVLGVVTLVVTMTGRQLAFLERG